MFPALPCKQYREKKKLLLFKIWNLNQSQYQFVVSMTDGLNSRNIFASATVTVNVELSMLNVDCFEDIIKKCFARYKKKDINIILYTKDIK